MAARVLRNALVAGGVCGSDALGLTLQASAVKFGRSFEPMGCSWT